MEMSQVEYARYVAASFHSGQLYGKSDPYINHLLRTEQWVREYLGEQVNQSTMDTACVAAILHDILEDTRYSCDTLALEFGVDVTDLVCTLTHKGRGANSEDVQQRYLEYIYRCAKNSIARVIKLADTIDHIVYLPMLALYDKKKASRLIERYMIAYRILTLGNQEDTRTPHDTHTLS